MIKVNQQLAAGILTLLCAVSGLAQQPKFDAVLSALTLNLRGVNP